MFGARKPAVERIFPSVTMIISAVFSSKAAFGQTWRLERLSPAACRRRRPLVALNLHILSQPGLLVQPEQQSMTSLLWERSEEKTFQI